MAGTLLLVSLFSIYPAIELDPYPASLHQYLLATKPNGTLSEDMLTTEFNLHYLLLAKYHMEFLFNTFSLPYYSRNVVLIDHSYVAI